MNTTDNTEPSNNLLGFLNDNYLLNDDDIDPDTFLNSELLSDITDTPVYASPYKNLTNIAQKDNQLAILSFNIRSISKNFDDFKIFLSLQPVKFQVICL